MKNLMKVLMVGILISMTLTKCSKDKIKGCTDPTGLNYNSKAEENDGSCIYEPCKNITCENGGICINGTCDCPQGYTGSRCELQDTPNSITLSKITVTSFDQNGDPDDVYPDIYIVLKDGSSYLVTSNYYTNATSPGNYDFILTNPIDLDPEKVYEMQLWDDDAIGSDDFLEFSFFSIYSGYDGFPNPIIITAGSFSFKLTVEYNW